MNVRYRVIKLSCTLVGLMSRDRIFNRKGVCHDLAADAAFEDAGIASAHEVRRGSAARRRLGGPIGGRVRRLLGSRRRGGL